MDAIAIEAIAALESALGGLLPTPIPNGLSRDVRVITQRIRPTGLGGFVGVQRDPDAALYGRRLSARVDVRVAGNAPADASAYAARLSGQLLAQTRSDLVQRGFRRLDGTPTDDDPSHVAFDVEFEYVHLPDAGEGVISTLDLEVFNNVTPYRAQPRWNFDAASLAVLPLPLAEFQAADDTDLDAGSPAGDWGFDALPTPRLAQRRDTHGGAFTLAEARKAGTQLLWRPAGLPLGLARGVMQFDFASSNANGVGAVFGRRAVDDHWFVLLSQAAGYHVLGRRTPGQWQLVGAPAAAGFSLGARHRVAIGFYDRTVFVELDGARTLTSTMPATVLAGEVGFLTHGNDGTSFYGGRLLELV